MRQSRRHAATSLLAYTQRLRCAGAPRRPAGPSLLLQLCFPCMLPTLPRRPAVPSRCAHTAISGFLHLSRSHHPQCPSLPAMPDGVVRFRGCIVRFMLRPARLPCPPDWLRRDEATCTSPRLLRYVVTPAFGVVRCRTPLGVRLDGRTGNLPSSGLSPDKSQQLVRLHDRRDKLPHPRRGFRIRPPWAAVRALPWVRIRKRDLSEVSRREAGVSLRTIRFARLRKDSLGRNPSPVYVGCFNRGKRNEDSRAPDAGG